MPIYEYQCSHCHHQFDEMQKMSDPPLTTCPKCSKNTAIRLVSAAGFQLKGTGWYVTDFKNKGKQPSTSETPSATESSAPAESKTTEKKDESN
ncbi:MAG TPA: zinc ribbon domain-containing protein [Legionellaceae bacterium]|nr:zinc ribbon domain-containing protein [Legionellaceae bacterium]